MIEYWRKAQKVNIDDARQKTFPGIFGRLA
jgi:hypothetical protein